MADACSIVLVMEPRIYKSGMGEVSVSSPVSFLSRQQYPRLPVISGIYDSFSDSNVQFVTNRVSITQRRSLPSKRATWSKFA